MPIENDPKQAPSKDSIIDQASEAVAEKFSQDVVDTDNPGSGQVEDQTETSMEVGGEPTQETPTNEKPVGADKGFASHPAWIERERLYKEAQGKLKEAEQAQQLLNSLLDDPRNYEKYLRSQGFSEQDIRVAMASRGFQTESKASMDTQTKRNIAEIACEKLGWNINALTPEQRAYINDHVALTEQVIDQKLADALDKRLKPLEENERERQFSRSLETGFEEAKRLAADEFPQYDWEKEILPAMNAYLEELDKRDPQKRIQITPQDLYEKATRNILKEKQFRDSRQAERNEAKKNARPLAPGIQSNASQGAKPKTWKDRVEQAIANR